MLRYAAHMSKHWAIGALALLLAAGSASAQGLPPLAPMPPVESDEALAAQILAFADYEDRMSVPVMVNANGPYRFIIDTGAERTVISRRLAGTLGLVAGRTINVAAMTGSQPVATVMIPSLEIDAVPRALAIEAPSLEAAHIGADGLVGLDSLGDSAVLIDFEANEMTVTRPTRRRPRVAAPGEIIVQARSLAGRLIVTDARYAGRRIAVILDTGTSVSVGNLKLLELVQARAIQRQPVQMLSVTGQFLSADYRTVPNIEVGDAEFKSLSIAFADVPPFARLGLADRPALFLGMDALRLFRRVSIDFPNRQVRFLLPKEAYMTGRMFAARMP